MKPSREQSLRAVIKFIFNALLFSSLILLDPTVHPAELMFVQTLLKPTEQNFGLLADIP